MFKAVCNLGLSHRLKEAERAVQVRTIKTWLKIKNQNAPAAMRAADGATTFSDLIGKLDVLRVSRRAKSSAMHGLDQR